MQYCVSFIKVRECVCFLAPGGTHPYRSLDPTSATEAPPTPPSLTPQGTAITAWAFARLRVRRLAVLRRLVARAADRDHAMAVARRLPLPTVHRPPGCQAQTSCWCVSPKTFLCRVHIFDS